MLVEVGCETDFVANTDKFADFVKDMTLQIVSSEGTQWVSVDDVPEEARDAELAIYRKQAADEGKPENIQQKIAEGRLDKWYAERRAARASPTSATRRRRSRRSAPRSPPRPGRTSSSSASRATRSGRT